jgi:2-iminobutanoate/2-iminopropanoate deaminase
MKVLKILFVVFILFQVNIHLSYSQNKKSKKEIILSEEAPKPIGPYSQAVKVGNMVFVSGQIGIDTSGKITALKIKDETEQVMKNIKEILSAAGLDMDKIVKTTIYLTDLNNFNEMNKVYSTFFTDNFPARETVEVAKLPKNARIEISVIAIK